MGRYARVVVDVGLAHLDRPFDYLIPDGAQVGLGSRVRVVFAGRRRNGWVVGLGDEPQTDPSLVRPLALVQGDQRWFDEADLALYRWVAQRYAGSLAAVLRHALPERVAAVEREAQRWPQPPPRQPAERPPCASPAWRPYTASALLRATAAVDGAGSYWLRPLPGDDAAALAADLVARCLTSGRGALVLAADPASAVPDAALAVAGGDGCDLRVGTARARYRAHLRCRLGQARVAAGERAAVFAPLRDLGLVLLDDEANPAYKERRAPRHHAREVALARARMAGAVCVLVSDLPSANLRRLLTGGHVSAVAGDRASERDRAPRVDVVDLSDPRARRTRLADRAGRAVTAAVAVGGAAVVLVSRGGAGSALVCRSCSARLACPVCAGSLRVRRVAPAAVRAAIPGADVKAGREGDGSAAPWECPSCTWEGPPFACGDCGGVEWSPLAAGAGRLAAELRRSHPKAAVTRMEGFDAAGPAGRPAVGVMTRGSVVTRPRWLGSERAHVLVLPDADAMLRRPALDAGEDALRLWLAAARWSRHVVVQTREPNHHAVQALVRWDPEGFWEREEPLRAALRYPPAASLVRLTASDATTAADVAAAAREALPPGDEVLGPDLAGALLVKSASLHGTLGALTPLRQAWDKADRKVRVDVDPL